MKIHELKTDPEVFDAVMRGEKTYEIREMRDRDFKVGDFLHLRKTQYTGEEMKADLSSRFPGCSPAGKSLIYTGESLKVQITHMLTGPIYGLKDGWCIMSICSSRKLKN